MKSNKAKKEKGNQIRHAVSVNSDSKRKKNTIGSIHAIIRNLLKSVGVEYSEFMEEPMVRVCLDIVCGTPE